MRTLALALMLTLACLACAPQASGPPRPGGEGSRLESGAFTRPEPPAPSPRAPAVDVEAREHRHPTAPNGPTEAPEEMSGVIVEIRGDELFLERPSGVELRFLLPQDVPIEPQGHTRADLVEGARVRVRVGHLERGMAVLRLVLEAAPSKP